ERAPRAAADRVADKQPVTGADVGGTAQRGGEAGGGDGSVAPAAPTSQGRRRSSAALMRSTCLPSARIVFDSANLSEAPPSMVLRASRSMVRLSGSPPGRA